VRCTYYIFDTINPMSRRKKASHKTNIPAMIILGAGLILVGLAAFIALPKADASANSPASGASLTVPVEVDYAAPKLTLFDLDGT
jgi:hypothetical protein